MAIHPTLAAIAHKIVSNRLSRRAKSLEEVTNQMLIANAQNTAALSQQVNQLTSGSSIKIETLQETQKTLIEGIEATRNIQQQARSKRAEDRKRLDAIKAELPEKSSVS